MKPCDPQRSRYDLRSEAVTEVAPSAADTRAAPLSLFHPVSVGQQATSSDSWARLEGFRLLYDVGVGEWGMALVCWGGQDEGDITGLLGWSGVMRCLW